MIKLNKNFILNDGIKKKIKIKGQKPEKNKKKTHIKKRNK